MILGDFGEYPMRIQRQLKIIKYWLQVISLPDSRLIRGVYIVIKQNNISWCHDVREKLTQCDMEDGYLADGHPSTDTYFMELIKARLQSKYCEIWAGDVNTMSWSGALSKHST